MTSIDVSAITPLIENLRVMTATASITPNTVGSLLRGLADMLSQAPTAAAAETALADLEKNLKAEMEAKETELRTECKITSIEWMDRGEHNPAVLRIHTDAGGKSVLLPLATETSSGLLESCDFRWLRALRSEFPDHEEFIRKLKVLLKPII